eukprot:GHVN01053906.1.p1 GENE.GHVN01053906.1~~GHVN01053906.1.p1  ORF type:complete len:174 (+),score=10.08 GHVN01053906.1:440-961(+)
MNGIRLALFPLLILANYAQVAASQGIWSLLGLGSPKDVVDGILSGDGRDFAGLFDNFEGGKDYGGGDGRYSSRDYHQTVLNLKKLKAVLEKFDLSSPAKVVGGWKKLGVTKQVPKDAKPLDVVTTLNNFLKSDSIEGLPRAIHDLRDRSGLHSLVQVSSSYPTTILDDTGAVY